MRKIKFSNDYIEFLNVVNNEVIESNAFPLSDIYFKFDKRNISFYLKSNDQPFKKSVWFDTLPLIIDDEIYDDYESASEALSVLFGSPSKELKEKVEEIDSNLNVALTNLENNTEDIETLQGQMESKADLSEVYTQERVDLLLNLKVDNSTLQNQYYDKNATDAKLALKSDKADTYNKTEVNSLLTEKANIDSVYNKSEVDIKLDEKADKLVSYTKDEINDLLDEKANYETIQGIEGSINNINDALSNHQSQLDGKADKEWAETEVSSLWSSILNHQVQLDGKANANEVYTKSEAEELLNQKANVEDLSLKADKTQLEDLNNNISQVEQEVVILTERIANNVYTKSQTDYLLGNKQDTLVNQENIKSVQNQDILGEGNIELFSMMNQAEYDSLEEKDSNKLYLITDTHRVYYQDNLIIDGSATPTPEPTGETETMVTFYVDEAEDYAEYAQLKGVAPYTITRQAVMDCLDEAMAEEGIARMVTKIELSDGVHRIDNEAFSGFTSLREVQYGANLKEMGSSAFTHCTSLTNLVIPDSVTGETDFLFTECSNATTCYVGTGITTLGGDTFCDCENLTSCHIPSNVTNLGGEHGGVFARCYSLTSVTVDGQIDHIGSNTFLETNSLTELWLTGCTNVPSVESDTFALSDPSNVTVHIPCNMRDDYEMSFNWDIFADHYVEEGDCDEPTGTLCMTLQSDGTDTNIYQNDGETIKEALDRYLGDTFGYDDDFDALHCNEFKSSITHVAFSNNITQIESTNVGLFGYGTDAGYGMYDGGWNNIVSVTLPNNLQTIGNYVFQIMPKVSQWNIPSTVTSIGHAAFERRTQDPNVSRVIRFNSNSCPSLGNSSFDIVDEEEMMVGADTNQTFKVNCGCLSDYSTAFANMGGSYEIYVINGLITEDCPEPEPTGETEGKLVMTLYTKGPDEEGSVAYEVYQNDGETVKQALTRFISDRCEGDTTSADNFKRTITHVVFDNSVTEISGVWLFGYGYGSSDDRYDSGWRNIVSVTLPSNLQTIGHDAFADMPKVERWDIPSTVTSIGYMAFQRDNRMENVNRTIRFNSIQPPLLESNVFDITETLSYAADMNQRIEAPIDDRDCEDLYSTYFAEKGGTYQEYIDEHILVVDECM